MKYSYGNKCIKCGRTVESEVIGLCPYCKRVKPQFDLAFAVFPYRDIFKESVKKTKFYNEYHRISGMAESMYKSFTKMNLEADCIVYVPTDIKTYYSRKYCFSQELAYEISRKVKVPVYKGFLLKKSNKKQSLVDFEDRYTNVKGAFAKNPFTFKSVKDKRVLLVDDILTTGSTLSECAGVLKKNGAKSVYAAALSYGAVKK